MSDDSKNWHPQPDDIDLLALLERSISFFRRNRWIFLTGILVGLLLGFLRYLSLPTVYKSRMILGSSLLSNQNYIQIADTWNALLRSGEHETLAVLFNMPDSGFQKVKQIKAEEIQKIFTQNNPNGFTIAVYVTDNSILDQLQKGIVFGFDNSDYVRDRLTEKRNKLQMLIEQTSSEINRLDSIKKAIENIIMGKGTSSSSLIVDGSTISHQIIDMNERLLNVKEELKFTSAVQVLQGFRKFNHPAGPNLYKWLLLGLIAGGAVAYFVAIIRTVVQKLKSRSKLPVQGR
jgi:hypothetical protein